MTKRKIIRIVLDTNLLVAGYFNPRSASAAIIKLCLSKANFKVLYTGSILKEAGLILRNIGASEKYKEKINDIFRQGKKVSKARKHMLIKEDREDNKFMDCAITANADYIVTNDVHMLKLGKVARLEVVRPAEFIRIIRKAKG